MSIIITDNGETAAVSIENNENNIRNERDFGCNICNKTFKTYRGLNQHIRSCLTKTHNNVAICTSQPTSNNIYQDPVREVNNDPVREVNNDQMREVNTFKWGNEGSVNITKYICDAYEKIVFWRKNILMLPTGSIGKKYVVETTKLLNAWTSNSPMKDIYSF